MCISIACEIAGCMMRHISFLLWNEFLLFANTFQMGGKTAGAVISHPVTSADGQVQTSVEQYAFVE
jgi:hypothetical protein